VLKFELSIDTVRAGIVRSRGWFTRSKTLDCLLNVRKQIEHVFEAIAATIGNCQAVVSVCACADSQSRHESGYLFSDLIGHGICPVPSPFYTSLKPVRWSVN